MTSSVFGFDRSVTSSTVGDLREMGERLIAMAEGIEGFDPVRVRYLPSETARVEEIQTRLLWGAEALYRLRQRRSSYIDRELLGEPGWDILLDLYVHEGKGKRLSVTSVCAGSNVPTSTALRWLAMLEKSGLVRREISATDRRRSFVDLTQQGRHAVSACLSEFFAGMRYAGRKA